MAKKILVVDDEPLIVKGLKFSLEQDGYEVGTAYNGEEALSKWDAEDYDIILLDVMLPGISGTDVCRQIREKSNVPIIMLTAKDGDLDKILGLEYGADDYMTKPFNILEVKARIKTIFRRVSGANDHASLIKVKNMVVDKQKRTVHIEGEEIDLTAKEFEILLLLITNRGKVYKREELLETIWKYEYVGDVRTVDVHIRRLRKKIEKNPDDPEYIFTKWGVGYFFTEK